MHNELWVKKQSYGEFKQMKGFQMASIAQNGNAMFSDTTDVFKIALFSTIRNL